MIPSLQECIYFFKNSDEFCTMIRSFGKTPKIAESAFVSETAYVIGDVEIGEESNVWPGAVIRGDLFSIKIGRNVSIEDNCVIHAGPPSAFIGELTVGDRVIIGHGAVIHCRSIGNNVLVGMTATLLQDAEIGNDCVIAAACLVGQGVNIPDNSSCWCTGKDQREAHGTTALVGQGRLQGIPDPH
jgi:carbonic anhydrase/acetyltransferase-like protein (isoleucine patch superfamily)